MLRRKLIFVFLPIALLAGCASWHRTPQLFVPPAQITSSHYIGTPLSGPRGGDVGRIAFDGSLDIHARWYVIEHFDPGQLPLLASQARLITARLGGAAVLPSGSLTSDARVLWSSSVPVQFLASARYAMIGESRAALPMGTTVAFAALDRAGGADQTLNQPESRRLEVSLARLGQADMNDKIEIGFTVEDAAAETTGSDVFQQETAIFEHALDRLPTHLLLLAPFKFAGSNAQAAAVIVTISPASADADFANVVAWAKADLTSPPPHENYRSAWALGLRRAMDSLNDPTRRRAALVFLAEQSGADICLDVVSVCDDAMLATLADSVEKNGRSELDDPNFDRFAWLMDRTSIAAMQPLLAKATLPPELFAILTLHLGEPGRHAAAVDDIMRTAASRKQLLDRLIAENYIYLEDSSPAARVRAFNWLTAHDVAPPGYDPLASPKERRTALDKALDARSAGGAP